MWNCPRIGRMAVLFHVIILLIIGNIGYAAKLTNHNQRDTNVDDQMEEKSDRARVNYTMNNCMPGNRCPCEYNYHIVEDGDVVLSLASKCLQLVCDNGNVVPEYFYGQQTCGCCEHNGRLYPDGAQLPGVCVRLYCICGEWHTTGHLHDCCQECRVFEDPHITTFDTRHAYEYYDWHDPCNYTLTQDITQFGMIYNPQFAVYASFELCSGIGTCVGNVIFVDSPETTIKMDIAVFTNLDTIWVNGYSFVLDFTPRAVEAGGETHQVLAWRHNQYCIRLLGSQNLLLQVCEFEIRIWAHPTLSDKLGGLCGKFNFYDQDDYTDIDGSQWPLTYHPTAVDPLFPESWKSIHQSESMCLTHSNPVKYSCDSMQNEKYKQICITILPPKTSLNSTEQMNIYKGALAACVADLCKSNNGRQTSTVWAWWVQQMFSNTLEINMHTVGEKDAVGPMPPCDSSTTRPPTVPTKPHVTRTRPTNPPTTTSQPTTPTTTTSQPTTPTTTTSQPTTQQSQYRTTPYQTSSYGRRTTNPNSYSMLV